ncbi:MAG: hypothetical protein ACPHA6_12220 [Paracoccaceae bacterium]
MSDSIFAWQPPASVADNDDADITINWSEGQNPSTVNNSARAVMARVSEFLSDLLTLKTTGGTGAAYTVTATQAPASLPDGFTVYLLPHATNTGTCTLNVSSLGAKPLRITSGSNAAAGDILINKPIRATYYLTGDEFLIDAANVSGSSGYLQNVVDDLTPQLGGQLDVNEQAFGDGTRELMTFTEDASAVNHINIENEATGSGPIISAAGDDTDIDLNLNAKGSGVAKAGGVEIVTLTDTQTLTNKTLTTPTVDSSAFLTEQSAAGADAAGSGQLWVKDDTPNNLYFTDDAGNDVQITNSGALAGGGGIVLVASATASDSSSVMFTDLSTTYFAYKLIMENFHPASDADIYFRVSTDNGSTYKSGAADYKFAITGRVGGSTAGTSSGGSDSINLTDDAIGTDTGEFGHFDVTIYNPAGSGMTGLTFSSFYITSGATEATFHGGGHYATAAATDAIQILCSTGNIASGEFKLYGIKAS